MAKKKILTIDDDPAITEYLQLKLGKEYNVVPLNDPEAALTVALMEAPDLVVCDIDMPELDGGEVCRILSEDGQTRNIPFLFLTSIVTAQEAKGLDGNFGGRPGVSKHAPIDEILQKIRGLIGD